MSTYRISYRDETGAKRKTKRFHVEFLDHRGRRQRVPAFTDRGASRTLESKLKTLVALRAANATPDAVMREWLERLAPDLRNRLAKMDLLTARQVAARRPLTELLDDWEKHLTAKGTSASQIRSVVGRALRVLDGVTAAHWLDIDAAKVEQFLKSARERETKPLSARTSNFHLQAARQFCKWAVRTGIASEDPLRMLTFLNAEEDRRRERRALNAVELKTLLVTTEGGPDRAGMSGKERALLYRVAAETGLRKNEIKTLMVADLDVADAEHASLRVRAANAKNGREARLPLRPATARALIAHIENRTPLSVVFTTPKHWRAADMLAADLATAEIKAKDDAGRVIDFHALRTTFGTNLARGAVPLQLAQRLMRHSDPKLTSSVYTVLSRDDERAAVAALPNIDAPADVPGAAEQRATGTDDAGPTLWGSLWGRGGFGGKGRDPEGPAHARFGIPGQTRTADPRFRKPVLYPAELRGRNRSDGRG